MEVERRAPLPGNRFRFRVRSCVGGREMSRPWLRRGRTKSLPSGNRCRAVSRWCPAGVPSASR
eukprot:6027845-Pyramimonas_sp.AAC.1